MHPSDRSPPRSPPPSIHEEDLRPQLPPIDSPPSNADIPVAGRRNFRYDQPIHMDNLAALNGDAPGRLMVQRCSAKCICGNALLQQTIKATAIVTGVVGYLLGGDLLGERLYLAPIVGGAVWIFSTLLSIKMRPVERDPMDVLAESIGYGVAGLILVPMNYARAFAGHGVAPDDYELLPDA